SGEFAEMYDGEYHPWNPPSWGVGTSGRVRPWEGGLNTESILEFLTGFAPDAGHNRLVLAPHLPEDMKEFTANRLFIGDTQISLQMKRASTKVWVLNLHLDKGTPISVVMDFWASHRTLGNIEASGAATWDKSAAETNGRQARCHFVLENGKDVSFTVAEDSRLPEAELNPPKPQEYQPEPYRVSNSNLLLITSPSGVFYKRRHTSPENFLSV